MPLLFAPDLPADNPGNIQAGNGLRPTLNGYAAFQNLQEYNASSGWGTLTTTPNNLWAHHFSINGRVIAGTPTKLYELSLTASGTFTVTDVSVGAGSYTAPSYATGTDDEADPAYWVFASVGDNVYASNKFTATQQKQASKGAAFTSVSGSPACSCMVNFKKFLFAGNVGTYGAVTGRKDIVAWCGIDNPGTWVPDQATEAGYYPLDSTPGRVVVMKPLTERLVIYKQNSIYLARYDGVPIIWAFDLADQNTGINAAYNFPPPLVDIGGAHIFVGANDIYLFDGQQPAQSITLGAVRQFLRKTYFVAGLGRLAGTRVTHDIRQHEIIFWSYGLVYNYRFKKWGAIPTSEIAIAVATCDSNVPSIGGGAPGVINDPGHLIVEADKKVYNRYNYSLDGSAGTWANQVLQCEGGNAGQATLLQRVVPKFGVTPTSGTPTLSYYRRVVFGGTAVADSTFTWDTVNLRFDGLRSAFWHRTDLTIPGTSTGELQDVEFSIRAPAGKRVEQPLVGARG